MDELIPESKWTKKERIELQRFLYKELIRLNILADNKVTEPQIFGLMSALVKKAKYVVNGEDNETRLNQLLDFLYQEQGFSCHYQTYFHTENLLLNKVLRNHQGMPVSLGAILLNLASVLDLPLYPVNFPTQLVIRAEITLASGRKENRFINPWNGTFLSMEQLNQWLEGEMGYSTQLDREFLQIATKEELLERLETVFKMALGREGKFEDILRLIEYRLLMDPNDPYEIRDRGVILASMDCYHAAHNDISYFIEQCPDDPSAMMLKLELANIEQHMKTNPLH